MRPTVVCSSDGAASLRHIFFEDVAHDNQRTIHSSGIGSRQCTAAINGNGTLGLPGAPSAGVKLGAGSATTSFDLCALGASVGRKLFGKLHLEIPLHFVH
jgi:hypothetical protein